MRMWLKSLKIKARKKDLEGDFKFCELRPYLPIMISKLLFLLHFINIVLSILATYQNIPNTIIWQLKSLNYTAHYGQVVMNYAEAWMPPNTRIMC